jgi:hypothetical protein
MAKSGNYVAHQTQHTPQNLDILWHMLGLVRHRISSRRIGLKVAKRWNALSEELLWRT